MAKQVDVTIFIIMACVLFRGNAEVAAARNVEDAAARNAEDAAARNVEDAAARNVEDAAARNVEDAAARNVEDAAARNAEDAAARNTEDPTARNTEDPTARSTEDPTARNTEDPTARSTEDPAATNTEEVAVDYRDMVTQILTGSVTLEFHTERMPETHLSNPDLDVMEQYIQTEKIVIDYLSSFSNEFQKRVVKTQMKFCPYETLCDFNVSASTDKGSCCKPCLCSKCDTEKGCCPSVLNEDVFNTVTATSTRDVRTNIGFTAIEEVTPDCTLQQLTLRPEYEQKGFIAISKCPQNADALLRLNCSRLYTKDLPFDSVLPVWSNKTFEMFKNKFCAMCNGVAVNNLVRLNPVYSCLDKTNILKPVSSEADIIAHVFADERCDITYSTLGLGVKLQECKYIISQCNLTGNWTTYDVQLDISCHAYSSQFTHEKYVFRNVFCAMCNGIDPDTVTCEGSFTLNADTFSFSGLLKLDTTQEFSTDYLEENALRESACSDNQMLDILTNQCKDLSCPAMRKLQRGQCINIYERLVQHYSYILYIRMKPVTVLTMADVLGNRSNWLLEIQDLFHGKFPSLAVCDVKIAFKVDQHYNNFLAKDLAQSALLYADARVYVSDESHEPWSFSEDLRKLHGTTFVFGKETNKSTEFVVYVMDKDDRPFKLIEELLGTKSIHGKIMHSLNAGGRIAILSQYAMTDTDGLTLVPYYIQFPINYVCETAAAELNVLHFSACPKVNISKLNVPWTQDIDGLSISGIKIPSNEYHYIDYLHVMVCTETFQEINDHLRPKRTLNTEVVVTIICNSLSVISLVITLAVFSAFPKLRTPLPGKNNMSLAASLIIAQIMLLIGSLVPFQQYTLSCKLVGLFIHFSWLYVVFWMNVCTYHMFRVLSLIKQTSSQSCLKRFGFYHVYACTMSSVCVLVNVASSVFSTGNIGYGGKVCYIISERNILLTFSIPTFLVVVSNLAMFVYVVINTKRLPSIRRNVQNDRNEIVIFAKLSSITGIAWLFGFLYTWTNVQVFSYIFIVLNAGQGVFILFAFVVNRQVLLLFRGLKAKSTTKSVLTNLPKTSNSGTDTVSSKL